jgi:hypothetical protein
MQGRSPGTKHPQSLDGPRVRALDLKTYVTFPPGQKPGSLSLDQGLAPLQEVSAGKH